MGKQLAWVGGSQFFDNSGDPLNGGKIYTYAPGTTTPMNTYQDSGLTTPHANPIVLDAYGRPPSNAIWLSGETKMVVKTSADVTLFTLDNINPDQSGFGDYSTKNADVATKSADYAIVAADDGKLLAATAACVFSTGSAASAYGNGFEAFLQNVGSGAVSFNPNGSETVDIGTGAKASVVIPSGGTLHVRCDGSNWRGVLTGGYRLRAIHVYTYDGTDIFIDGVDQNNAANTSTWTKPDWCRAVRAYGVGGGGGGGGANSAASETSASAGGGGGGYCDELITAPGSTETITVGAAGAAGVSTGGTGGTGGNSSFGSHWTASGGVGGGAGTSGTALSGASATPGAGGAASGGAVNIPGQAGGYSIRLSSSAGISGAGGNSQMGKGGAALHLAGAAGTAGSNYGAGGAGGYSVNNTDYAGGVGTAGCVVVEEYE